MSPEPPLTLRDHLTGTVIVAALYALPGLINLIP